MPPLCTTSRSARALNGCAIASRPLQRLHGEAVNTGTATVSNR